MGKRKSVKSVPRISRTTSRNNGYDGSETLLGAAEEQMPKASSQKRQGSPLPAVRNKRAKLEGTGEAHSANVIPPSAPLDNHHVPTREERLRADPYADVRGAQLVICRLCGTEVKLSSKATYGLSHWKRHSERCRSEHEANNAEVVLLGATLDASRGDTAEKPGCKSPSLRAVRVSSGSSPLKLKLKLPGRARKQVSTPSTDSGEESTSTAAVSDMLGECETHTQDVGPSSPMNANPSWDDDSHIRTQHKQTMSQQSNISDIGILTPPDPHGDLVPTVTISSASCSVSDDGENTFEHPELPDRVAKWTDAPHTTSPVEIVFAEASYDTNVVAESRVDTSDAEVDHTVGPATHTGVATLVEAPILEVNGKYESDGSKDPAVLQPSGPACNALPVSEAETSPSLPDVPSSEFAISGHSPEEETLSDFDLEYPDWVLPTPSSAFERELQASGICLENVINYRSLLIAV